MIKDGPVLDRRAIFQTELTYTYDREMESKTPLFCHEWVITQSRFKAR